MQNIKKIINEKEKFKQIVKNKNIKLDIDELIASYEAWKNLKQELDDIRQERNENVDKIKSLSGKPPKELIDRGKEIKERLLEKEKNYSEIESKYKNLLLFSPQEVSDDTPIGKDDSENVEVRRWSPEKGDGGDPKPLNFEFKDHIELAESLNLVDFDKGVETAGFRGYYLKNEAVMLHAGLMMFGLQLIQEKGFELFYPPTIVKKEALVGSGHFPFDEENIYSVDSLKHIKEGEENSERKYLVGTAEPPLLNYFRDEVIDEKDLPIRTAGYSQCYRSEVGSYGKDTKGIYRIHEFMKVEQVVFCKNDYEESTKQQELMIRYSEELLQKLKLPYRVIQVCTGDMGAGKYRMFDIETWMPSREGYGETHSASNLGDWQTRRLNVKVRGKDGKKYYPHALNNTVVASPRILIAILENYQNEDGSITVPEVLVPYVGKKVIK